MIHRPDPAWGSHLAPLIKTLLQVPGPVLELGMGISSTPVLHALCADQGRLLISYDNDPVFTEGFKKYQTAIHRIRLVKSWDEVTPDGYGIVLVDHKPEERRKEEVKKFAYRAHAIVIHDSEPDKENLYHLSEIYPLFKYRFDYKKDKVHTTVLSNFHAFN